MVKLISSEFDVTRMSKFFRSWIFQKLEYLHFILFILILVTLVAFALFGQTLGQIFDRTGLALTEVPPDIPPNVGEVNLDSNSISSLATGVFSNLTQCSLLSLRENSIRSIDDGAFNGLENLGKLDLFGNNMKILEQGMFNGIPHLRVLNIAENGIHTISEGCFRNLGILGWIVSDSKQIGHSKWKHVARTKFAITSGSSV